MSAAIISGRIQKLIKKTSDVDKDERFMACSDLCTELTHLDDIAAAATAKPVAAAAAGAAARAPADGSALDQPLQQALSRTLLTLLEDPSTDVQSVAVKCLGVLVRRLSGDQLAAVSERLGALVAAPEKAESRDIYAIGIKTMVNAVATTAAAAANSASPAAEAQRAIGVNLAHRILTSMISALRSAPSHPDAEVDITSTCLEIITVVLARFGAAVSEAHEPLLASLETRLESEHDSVRKRTISTLASLVPLLSDRAFQSFVELVISSLARHEAAAAATGGAGPVGKKHSALLYSYLQMTSVVSTTAGARIGRYLPRIVPLLQKFLHGSAASGLASPSKGTSEDVALQDLWTYSLEAFEALLQRCPQDFVPFVPSVLARAEELLCFDPNYIYADSTSEAMDAESDGAAAKAAAADGEDDWGSGGGGGGGGDDDDDWGAGADDDAADMDHDADDGGQDDASWKVRRAAVKLVAAYIRSKATSPAAANTAAPSPDLASRYAHLCDLLLERLKERDSSVKLALLQALQDLVREGGVSEGGLETASSATLRQKVPSIVSACVKQLKSPGASATAAEAKHSVLSLLIAVCQSTRGSGAGAGMDLPRLVPLLQQTLTGPAAGKVELKLDAVALLRALVDLVPASGWSSSLGGELVSSLNALVSALVASAAETGYIKYKSEVLSLACSLLSLLGALKAGGVVLSDEVVQSLYSKLIYPHLQMHDVDQELKEATLAALGAAFFFFGSELQRIGGAGKFLRDSLSIVLTQRLSNELTRIASLRCLSRIAQAPAQDGLDVFSYVFAAPVAGSEKRVLDEVTSFLRKDSQLLRHETVQTLIALLHNIDQAGGAGRAALLTQPQFSQLLRDISAHLLDTDLNLAGSIFVLVSRLFFVFPQLSVHSTEAAAVQDADAFLARLLQLLRSPLLQQQNITPVVSLMRGLMSQSQQAGAAVNPHLTFQHLFDFFLASLTQPQQGVNNAAQQAAAVPSPAFLSHMAHIVGSGLMLHLAQQQAAPVVLQQLLAMIKSGNAAGASDVRRQFALLVLGELGRNVYLAKLSADLNESVFFDCFHSESEAVRTASSVAFGNVMLGNVSHYLPTLLRQLQDPNVAQRKELLLLLLHSLNQLILNLTSGQQTSSAAEGADSFRSFLPTLLPLLWSHAESSEESIRSCVSEVLGGVLIIDSATTFPEMVRLVAAPQPNTRSVVITALRHSLTMQQHAGSGGAAGNAPTLNSALLQQHLPSFLQLLRDPDLIVRRQAILTVNALAHSRSHAQQLLTPAFQSTVLPILFHHLTQDPALVRIVDLGPFKHKIDDGFPLRKASYQTLSTLLDVAYAHLDPVAFLRHVSQGLTDSDDIVILVYQILETFSVRHPQALALVLDELHGKMMDGVKEKLKAAKTVAPADASASAAPAAAAPDASTAERAKDVLRAAVRSLYSIQAMPTVGACPGFIDFYQRVLKTQLLARMLEEMRAANAS